MEEKEEGIEVPEEVVEFSDLSVFSKEQFEKIEVIEDDIKVIGNVELNENEKAILRLHTKFALLENLKP